MGNKAMNVVQAAAESFVEKIFHHHMYSFSFQVCLARDFLSLACALGFLSLFSTVRCKAVLTATLCNAEFGPLGYKNKVENYYSIYLEELSNTDHCYPLSTYILYEWPVT